jgi:hypothetical protein
MVIRLRSKRRGPIPPHPRQGVRLPLPRAPSIDRLLPGVSLSRGPIGGSPPPVSRLCHRGPGFRRAFAAPMLSPGMARPGLALRGSSPWRRDGPTSPVDFCNQLTIHEHNRRIVRTPRTTPAVARERSCFSNRSPFEERTDCGWPCARHSQSRRHGPGAGSRANPPSMLGASRRDRSR